MSKRAAFMILAVTGAALFATGCSGSTKSIDDVNSCLKDIKGMSVNKAPASDSGVKEGVFATTDISKGGAGEFTMAMAANVKSDKDVKTFQDQSKQFAATDKKDKSFTVDTGVDGKYVWVAGGAKNSDTYDAALKCVKP